MSRLLAIFFLALLPCGPALAACGDDGSPGYRGPDGRCVTWCNLDKICGEGGGKCTPENPSRIITTIQGQEKGNPALPKCQGCGCKGGPGYRSPSGRCVAWEELQGACGSPPTKECRAEIVQPTAAEFARAQDDWARLKRACR